MGKDTSGGCAGQRPNNFAHALIVGLGPMHSPLLVVRFWGLPSNVAGFLIGRGYV